MASELMNTEGIRWFAVTGVEQAGVGTVLEPRIGFRLASAVKSYGFPVGA